MDAVSCESLESLLWQGMIVTIQAIRYNTKQSTHMSTQLVIGAEAFRSFAIEVLRIVGAPSQQAEDTAAPLVWASLRGVDTHGVRNFKSYYVDTVVDKQIKAQPEFAIEHETSLSVRANGDRGLGLAAGCWGMRLAIEKAREAGVGLVSMRNSNHLGALGFFAEMAAEHDMIGLCMSGHLYADGTDRGMAPVFSLQPMFGTNPLSVAIPCSREPTYVLDMATATVPVNRVEMMREAGKSIPAGWCLDAAGNPTTDPTEAKVYLPLGGTRELGAHKGFGLAIVVEVLTALLSTGWSPTADRRFAQDEIAHFFGAIRIDMFRDPSEFKTGMDAMIDALHQARPAPGQERVYVPGEIEHEIQHQRSRDGIPLSEKEVSELRELSARYGVDLSLSERS
jgi:LDH2 family malate/lactate/ureidoglycolate dehydrogenase